MRALLLAATLLAIVAPAGADPAPAVEVYFSPRGGCADAVVALIRGAKRSVRQAAYAYTSGPIADAMIAARRAGVDARLLVDKSYAKRPEVERLRAAGVPVYVDKRHAIMHSKYTVVDGVTVQTGSFNYSAAAEKSNSENCIVLRRSPVAGDYAADWNRHIEHAEHTGG